MAPPTCTLLEPPQALAGGSGQWAWRAGGWFQCPGGWRSLGRSHNSRLAELDSHGGQGEGGRAGRLSGQFAHLDPVPAHVLIPNASLAGFSF